MHITAFDIHIFSIFCSSLFRSIQSLFQTCCHVIHQIKAMIPSCGWLVILSFWRASVDDAGTDFDLFSKYICIVCWCFSFLWICNSILVSVQYSISGFFSIKIARSYRSRMLRNFRQQFAWNVWMFISEILSRTSGRDCHLFQTNDSDWPALV